MTGEAEALSIERITLPSPEDRDAILALEAEAFSNPWTAETFDRMLTVPVSRLFVARTAAGRIVAFGACWLIKEDLHINTVAVAASERRRGYGSQLLAGILAETAPRRATLEVRRSNEAALRLYARFGFQVTAVRPKYYDHPEEDGLILWMNP